jgi:transcriptional regulator with XRE-family HTH domain
MKTNHRDTQTALRELLFEARKKAGLTQATLSKRLGRPQSFVAKVENGERRVDVLEFVRYAMALGLQPAKLLGKLHRAVSSWD